MEDTLHHKQYRQELLRELREKGIRSEAVLTAIGKVPRHLFVERKLSARELYEDVALAIGQGQTISQPYTVAYQTQLLHPKPGDRILEIGTGSGYQAAVLFELGVKVYSIERQKKLYDETRKRLNRLGYSSIHLYYGDGSGGLADLAPFDKILITAAAPGIPHELTRQLVIGGNMVVPVGADSQRMLRITRISETEISTEDFGPFHFVPMLPGFVD